MKYYFLFNPLAGKGKAQGLFSSQDASDEEVICADMTEIEDYKEFFSGVGDDDIIIVCGGDGTLNRFINNIEDLEVKNEILYFPAGSGNDFMNDLDRVQEGGSFRVNEYIKNLPSVTIKGKDYRFINGVGFGVDGFVCTEGDRLRNKGKKVNYTTLAVKCLLKFKPVNATLTVDGVTKKYKKVWMTTAMKGRYFGGGMMLTPDQRRYAEDGKISVLVVHDIGRFKLLTLFPSIFEGKHVKYTNYIEIIKCDSMSVEYDTSCSLQIDGEPMADITGYSVTTEKKVKA